MKKKTKNKIRKFLKKNAPQTAIGYAAGLITFALILLCSCNATRTITTTQTHIKGQDTITTMTTRTTESYDASIKPKNVF